MDIEYTNPKTKIVFQPTRININAFAIASAIDFLRRNIFIEYGRAIEIEIKKFYKIISTFGIYDEDLRAFLVAWYKH